MGKRRPFWRGRSRPTKKSLGDASDPVGFPALIAAHLAWQRTKNFSPITTERRERLLAMFLEWAELRGLVRPADVTRPVLERYQRWLFHYRKTDGRPLSFGSQKDRLIAVRTFFQWLARQHLILANPASDLELPRLPQRLPRAVLTAEEAERVFAAVDQDREMALRDRAILETFYATGIRRCELAALHVGDVVFERGVLVVREGKGKKDRVVPLGQRAQAWIERYLAQLRPRLALEPDEGWLFLTEAGESLSHVRLGALVRRYVLKAGLGKVGSCHLFRHTMATLMLENGADIRFVQQMLGHSNLNTTQVYAQVSIRKLQEIHAATHPGARLASAEASSPSGEVLAEETIERRE